MNSVPKKKRLGYDVDQEARTNRNKRNSPMEPTPRKEERKKKPNLARTHTKKVIDALEGHVVAGFASTFRASPQPAPAPTSDKASIVAR